MQFVGYFKYQYDRVDDDDDDDDDDNNNNKKKKKNCQYYCYHYIINYNALINVSE